MTSLLQNQGIQISIALGVVGLAVAVVLIRQILAASAGNERMAEIAGAVQEGAKAYLSRQVAAVSLIAVVLFAAIWWARGSITALGFVVGALCSLAAGFIGMHVAVRANVRTAQAASVGAHPALKIAFNGGAVTGLLVVALGLLSVGVFYLVVQKITGETKPAIESLIGLALGSSLISVFARLGGGIYTKAADVGADLVGKNEQNLPEDDPRNPATIADNVGDNVGDCAGMAADLFETYVVTVGATMVLTALLLKGAGSLLEPLMALPLLIGGVCIVTSIIGTYFVRLGGGTNVMGAMYKGFLVSAILAVPAIWWAISYALGSMESTIADTGFNGRMLFYCTLLGLVITGLIIWITEYYTGTGFRPVRSIAKASETGHGTNVIQ
ncbi:MAG: sodium/proton-translocating pyrophosphatase, partial [Verrucomicrobiales bacterium]|nr:sodium/proton-translocating pyrophosphatase [Verrucomicrobiales bacterium]